jgi:hypothetical protein
MLVFAYDSPIFTARDRYNIDDALLEKSKCLVVLTPTVPSNISELHRSLKRLGGAFVSMTFYFAF